MSNPNPKDFVLPFGEHKGKTLDQAPLKYLDWLIGQPWLYGDTRLAVKRYLDDPVIQQELQRELEQ